MYKNIMYVSFHVAEEGLCGQGRLHNSTVAVS